MDPLIQPLSLQEIEEFVSNPFLHVDSIVVIETILTTAGFDTIAGIRPSIDAEKKNLIIETRFDGLKSLAIPLHKIRNIHSFDFHEISVLFREVRNLSDHIS